MDITDLPLKGLKLVQTKIYRDHRGFFVERFKESVFRSLGIDVHFCQDNHSRSAPRVLRGLHYQSNPAQGKLVGVARGKIWDVVVDIRAGSPTFGQHFGLELNDQDGKLLWVPHGFAHGCCVLGDQEVDLLYKVTGEFNGAASMGIRWNDPALGIKWPIQDPILSDQDKNLPHLKEIEPLKI
jgi:dTDP-4-dehydrorhamnose 3,5-epimerase